VDNVRTIFVDLYGDQLRKPHTTLVRCDKFDDYFDQQMRELDKIEFEAGASFSENDDGEPPPMPGLKFRGKRV
jgi:signal recognition particle receptor subunit alpha